MHPNYQLSFARKAQAALPRTILSNRPGMYACAIDGERYDDLN